MTAHRRKTEAVESKERAERNHRLTRLIRPLRTAKWSADYSWDRLEPGLKSMAEDYGGLVMNPDFQRGHVWTPDQQQHFIENCLRGVVTTAGLLIQFNCESFSSYQNDVSNSAMECLDGLQRYTAITEYVKGNVKPFGLSVDEYSHSSFDPRRFYIKVAIHDFTNRAQMLQYYLDINSGGTMHTSSELDRVKGLMAMAQSNT